MTLNFNSKIEFSAGQETKAIFDSVSVDNKFYPENPTKTKITFNKKILIHLQSEQIPHLRANLNSTLRLIQASYDSINSVKI
jgi:KEOPS complex subunit Pcc1|tara:strand:- start:803 stop:1048 length:246 start_codon:yes stop_codon:yes gene_type:complete